MSKINVLKLYAETGVKYYGLIVDGKEVWRFLDYGDAYYAKVLLEKQQEFQKEISNDD